MIAGMCGAGGLPATGAMAEKKARWFTNNFVFYFFTKTAPSICVLLMFVS